MKTKHILIFGLLCGISGAALENHFALPVVKQHLVIAETQKQVCSILHTNSDAYTKKMALRVASNATRGK